MKIEKFESFGEKVIAAQQGCRDNASSDLVSNHGAFREWAQH